MENFSVKVLIPHQTTLNSNTENNPQSITKKNSQNQNSTTHRQHRCGLVSGTLTAQHSSNVCYNPNISIGVSLMLYTDEDSQATKKIKQSSFHQSLIISV